MRVTTVGQMRNLDRRAVETFAIPEQVLMENAGLAALAALRRLGPVAGRRFLVLCGPGNNGGDGLVVARQLLAAGGSVEVALFADPASYRGASAANLEMARRCDLPLTVRPETSALAGALARADLLVDALLGTGITRDVSGPLREAIEALNRSGREVLALDIPSGVDGDTGQVRAVAVRATATVTFGLPKRGNLLYPGAAYGGRLFVDPISFPPALTDDPTLRVALSSPPPLPPRPADGHKGTFGDVLFVAGAAGYYGAPSFAALSFLRAGGGYSRLAAPRSVVAALAPLAPEVVFHPQAETAEGSLALAALPALSGLSSRVDLVVVGPGLSLAAPTQELVRRLADDLPRPLLIDGDGLTAVARHHALLRRRSHPTILTPHPGEMARLAGVTPRELAADPVGILERLAGQLEAIIVFKGAHSLIGLPDGRVLVNPSGNSGMASAGAGDVLTGTIAAAFGLGLPLEEAVPAGVLLHGLAGDLAAARLGADGVTAREILESLPAAVRQYREQHAEMAAGFFGAVERV